MKLIIDIDKNLVYEGFVRNFTEEEKEVLISSVRTGIPYEDRPHGECNQCQHFHGGCSFWGIGGVLSSDYCSRFEREGETE